MIDVSHLKKNYRSDAGELIVLDDVTFRVEKGEFFCIVGSSGSGKSTLLRCLATIDKDCEGKILIDGVGHKEYVSRKSIAFVSQDYSNFPWLTVKQNIQLGNPSADEPVVNTTLKRLGLHKFQDYFPSQLSGGMRQRVAIARALIQGTDIILFDEPFGALDVQTRSQMQELLLRIWQEEKKTIIFVTHDIDEAIFLADRVLVLSANTGTIQQELLIDLPRPRTTDLPFSPAFARLKKSVVYSIRAESIKASLKKEKSQENICNLGLFIWSGNAPWYAAHDQGIFEKKGLNTHLLSTDSTVGNLEMLLEDKVDILNVTLDYAVRAIYAHPDLQIILPLNFSDGGDAVIARSGITKWTDLKGKKIGIEQHAVSHFFLRYLLKKNGLSPMDIKEVNMHGSDIGSALIRGDIDAAVLWEPWLSKAVELSDATILASTKDKENQILYDVLIAKKSYIREHEQVVRTLAEIWKEASDAKEASKIRASVASSMGVSDKDAEVSLKKIRFIQTYTTDFFAALAEIQQFYFETGLITTLLDPQKFISDPVLG